MGDENLKPALQPVFLYCQLYRMTPGISTYDHKTAGFFAGPGMTHRYVNRIWLKIPHLLQ